MVLGQTQQVNREGTGEIKLTRLRVPVPPTVNHLYPTGRNGRRYKSKQYSAWLEEAGWSLKAQRPDPITGPVSVCYFIPEHPKRDLANHEKPLSDLLAEHRVIGPDDRSIKLLIMMWSADTEVDVVVRSLDWSFVARLKRWIFGWQDEINEGVYDGDGAT